ncbi:MAG: hypothetical protein RLZZ584_943 [Pseudomonadota bacterium]|jgi:prolipoprotein diacylglyceryltransferase
MISSAPWAALAHATFEYAGIALGLWLYRRARARNGQEAMSARGSFALMCGLLIGAAIGNKAVYLVERPDVWLAFWRDGAALQLGQSIVGGLLGGLIGIEIAKGLSRQPASTGDLMVLPLMAGMALGRVGCFVAGLHDDTYGLPTGLPWAVDLGDGIGRHPAPLYEVGALAVMAAWLHVLAPLARRVPGLSFKWFLAAYLIWRLVCDGLKPVPVAYVGGLSGIQWVCLLALCVYLPIVVSATRAALRRSGGQAGAVSWKP